MKLITHSLDPQPCEGNKLNKSNSCQGCDQMSVKVESAWRPPLKVPRLVVISDIHQGERYRIWNMGPSSKKHTKGEISEGKI